MNYSTAIFLISDRARCVKVNYEPDAKDFYAFKTFDPDIAVDDLVVVPTNTRHGMTVCRVAEVDIEPDFNAHYEMKWLVGRVDRASYDEIIGQEAEAVAKMRRAEKRRKRKQLRADMIADSEAELKALPIYDVSDTD